MLLLVFLAAVTLVLASDGKQLALFNDKADGKLPGDSIIRLCPESRETDLLQIARLENGPRTPYLNEMQDIYLYGMVSKNISADSTVDWQANTSAVYEGDSSNLSGHYNICQDVKEMHQPFRPGAAKLHCPPDAGDIFIQYEVWFAPIIAAAGNWSVKFDWKTPKGERIFCLEAKFYLQCLPENRNWYCHRNDTDELDSSKTTL